MRDSTFIRHGRTFTLGALVAALSAVAIVGLSAWAGEGSPRGMHGGACPGHFQHASMAGHMGGEPGGAGGFGMMMGGRHFDHMLDEVNATPAQREQIKQIRDKAMTDGKAVMDEGGKLREQAIKLWGEPKLDPAAAEKLRLQMQAHHDKVSKQITQTMLDIGKVLTPEQRAKLSAQMLAHHGAMHAGMSGSQPEGKGMGMGQEHQPGRPMEH
jgi:protein CpxP